MRLKINLKQELNWRGLFLGGYKFESLPVVLNLDGSVNFYYSIMGVSPAEELKIIGKGSQYAMAFIDAAGNPLNGGSTYLLQLPPNVTVKDFWSVILYDYQTRSLLQTDQQFPMVSSQGEGLLVNPGNLWVYTNLVLSNLTGLDGMETIGANIWIDDNSGMTSLEGIDNLNANYIGDLTVSNNTQLSTCDIQSICDYLTAPNGEIVIENNSTGCNSIEEVEEASETASVYEISILGNITISPNPFSIATSLSYDLQQPEKVSLSIYNHLGQIVYQTQENQPKGNQQLIWNAERNATIHQ